MTADVYYNEFDPHAAAWIRNLIAAGLVSPGEVDEKDVRLVLPREVVRRRRAHFFAGIAGWERALELAGWGNRPVWTASLPCQPFSSAGRQEAEKDERHLWPDFRRLVAECRPECLVGEQVASNLGRDWYAGVRSDLEALGYAVGAADLCAACAGEEGEGWIVRGDTIRWERIVVGAPHIRQRLYWVARRLADAGHDGRAARSKGRKLESGSPIVKGLRGRGEDGRLGDSRQSRLAGRPGEPGDDGPQLAPAQRASGATGRVGDGQGQRRERPFAQGGGEGEAGLRFRPAHDGDSGRLGESGGERRERREGAEDGRVADGDASRRDQGTHGPVGVRQTRGFWSDFDAIPCTDGKARRTQPGLFPLVDGAAFRLADGRTLEGVSRPKALKGIGNAIVPELAAVFLRCVIEILDGR